MQPKQFCELVSQWMGWEFNTDRDRDRVYSLLLAHVLDASPDTITKWKCLQEKSVIPAKYKNHLMAKAALIRAKMEIDQTLQVLDCDRPSLDVVYKAAKRR